MIVIIHQYFIVLITEEKLSVRCTTGRALAVCSHTMKGPLTGSFFKSKTGKLLNKTVLCVIIHLEQIEGESMDLEDIKKEISAVTGIPSDLIQGETPEELICSAKALIAYRNKATRGARIAFDVWADKDKREAIEGLQAIEKRL